MGRNPFVNPSQTTPPDDPRVVAVIEAAHTVRGALGGALTERAYVAALQLELVARGVPVETEHIVPAVYKSTPLRDNLMLSLLVDGEIAVLVVTTAQVEPIDEQRLHTLQKLGGWKVRLLIHFRAWNFEENAIRKREI